MLLDRGIWLTSPFPRVVHFRSILNRHGLSLNGNSIKGVIVFISAEKSSSTSNLGFLMGFGGGGRASNIPIIRNFSMPEKLDPIDLKIGLLRGVFGAPCSLGHGKRHTGDQVHNLGDVKLIVTLFRAF